jgi:hypothetical protein
MRLKQEIDNFFILRRKALVSKRPPELSPYQVVDLAHAKPQIHQVE